MRYPKRSIACRGQGRSRSYPLFRSQPFDGRFLPLPLPAPTGFSFDVGFDASIVTSRSAHAPTESLPRSFSFKVLLPEGVRAEQVRIRIPTLNSTSGGIQQLRKRLVARPVCDRTPLDRRRGVFPHGGVAHRRVRPRPYALDERRLRARAPLRHRRGDLAQLQTKTRRAAASRMPTRAPRNPLSRGRSWHACAISAARSISTTERSHQGQERSRRSALGNRLRSWTTRDKLGRTMKVMAVPDGLESYCPIVPISAIPNFRSCSKVRRAIARWSLFRMQSPV